MATKKTPVEIINESRPKEFKYKIIITNDEFWNQIKDEVDIDSLDTIKNDELTQKALEIEYKHLGNIIGKAKEPTLVEDGIYIFKKMVAKADKKLLDIGLGFFEMNHIQYSAIKFIYESFYILEIFIMI